MLDILVSDRLLELLMISITFSVFLMALIQKIKKSKIFHYKWQIWFLNLLFSFVMGIPFTRMFYQTTFKEAIWVSIFGFIGAPTLYETLKKQNIITYKPTSITPNDTVSLPKENEIKREDIK